VANGQQQQQQQSLHNGSEATANVVAAAQARLETYQRVRKNRQARLSAKTRCGKRPRHVEETQCPVCSQRLSGSPDELNEHVDQCPKKSRGGQDEDGLVDVDGDSSHEEYTWAGQTRIRAASMMEGGYRGVGFAVSSKTRDDDDDDVNLDVDGDDSAVYGKPQYCESDIIPCRGGESDDDKEPERLRDEYLRTAVNKVQSQPSERNRWVSESECSSQNAFFTKPAKISIRYKSAVIVMILFV
jgi:hypothetical protein